MQAADRRAATGRRSTSRTVWRACARQSRRIPTENRAANDLEAEACERLLDQIMSSLRHIETAHNSGRMIWRVKGRYKRAAAGAWARWRNA